jgi:hypothetical protein
VSTVFCCPICGGDVEFFDMVDVKTGDRMSCWDCLSCDLRGWYLPRMHMSAASPEVVTGGWRHG